MLFHILCSYHNIRSLGLFCTSLVASPWQKKDLFSHTTGQPSLQLPEHSVTVRRSSFKRCCSVSGRCAICTCSISVFFLQNLELVAQAQVKTAPKENRAWAWGSWCVEWPENPFPCVLRPSRNGEEEMEGEEATGLGTSCGVTGFDVSPAACGNM